MNLPPLHSLQSICRSIVLFASHDEGKYDFRAFHAFYRPLDCFEKLAHRLHEISIIHSIDPGFTPAIIIRTVQFMITASQNGK